MSDFGSQPPGFPAPPPPPPPNMAPPPGYVGYGGPGAAMDAQYSRIGGISKAMRILLMILIPLQLVGLISLFTIRDKARDFLNGDISEKKFEEATQANLGTLSVPVIIAIIVLTMILMFRMARNVQQLGRPGATWAPGWAIGGWFCPPCVIYAIPWLMFRELWRGSDPDVAPNDPSWKARPVSPIVNAWWILYGFPPLVSLFTLSGLFATVGSFETEDLAKRVDDYIVLNVVLAVVQIIAAVLYLLMISQLSARHMRATREA
jgi:hypothetical protein